MSEPTPPIFGWIKDNWEWLSAIAIAAGALIWAWVKVMVIDRIKAMGKTQARIVRVIPVEALEKGQLLATQDQCTALRSSCQNHTIAEELSATMTVIKQAMALVISHNNDIPQEKKDKIMDELVR